MIYTIIEERPTVYENDAMIVKSQMLKPLDKRLRKQSYCFNLDSQVALEMAVESACMVQSIDLSGVSGKIAVTLLVTKFFHDMLGESIGYAKCVLLTAVSRVAVEK
jgi:hypothetical protein